MKAIRKPQILVLDSDPAVLDYVHRILADRFNVSLFTDAAEMLQRLEESPAPNLLLMDWHITEDDTEENTLSLLLKIRASMPSLPIITFACFAELKEVVAASRVGSVEMILKPFRKSDIDLAVQQCLQGAGKHQFDDDDVVEIPLDENKSFVRASKRMREIESQCRLLARADIPVLILGESGTGKEVATMFIHKMSERCQRNFLKVNCAAMPADLLESELFGYEQGAFTGAYKSKPGKFEICNNGTIFLDEIGEMPVVLQAKLLQVLQDGSFARLGGHSIVKVNVRVIAATNIDIKAAIEQKTFREDLYYRLNGFTLKMPPLRERTEEIPILAFHFMRKVAAKHQRDPLPISPELMQALTSYSWPGNLRELENTITRYIILADEQAIISELYPRQAAGTLGVDWEDNDGNAGLKHLVRNLKSSAESSAIAQALASTGWNRKIAASDMQISYKALLNKIKEYNLSPPPRQQSPNRSQGAFPARDSSQFNQIG
jgi:two-component system response regulator AtoC